MSSSPEIPTQISRPTWGRLGLRTLRSALARLRFKEKRKYEGSLQRRTDEVLEFAPIWHSGTKGDGTAPQLNGARYFSFEELKQCTDNFSENNFIGQGGLGKTYKGCCTDGVVVAVKRVNSVARGDRSTEEVLSEIQALSRVHHKNIVRLIGLCYEQGEKLLVYEYMSMGTLKGSLAGERGMYLDWRKRLQIALDSARGLAYLHELANPIIIHRDIKSGEILLDENLIAKVTNFGLSKMVSEKEKGHVSSQGRGILAQVESDFVAGTFGYIDPEYMLTRVLSEKSDVYGFGVVMLELITARRPFSMEFNLVESVKKAIDENDDQFYGLRNMIDPKIVNQVRRNVSLRKFVRLALECLKDSGSDRPSMCEIMKEIDIILHHDESERTASADHSDDDENRHGSPFESNSNSSIN